MTKGSEYKLTDEQWLVLDLLMRAREKGVHALNRMEVLTSATLPRAAAAKLIFAALLMPEELVKWTGQHDFSITDEGVSLFNLRFGKKDAPAKPTQVADVAICLPGPEHYKN